MPKFKNKNNTKAFTVTVVFEIHGYKEPDILFIIVFCIIRTKVERESKWKRIFLKQRQSERKLLNSNCELSQRRSVYSLRPKQHFTLRVVLSQDQSGAK